MNMMYVMSPFEVQKAHVRELCSEPAADREPSEPFTEGGSRHEARCCWSDDRGSGAREGDGGECERSSHFSYSVTRLERSGMKEGKATADYKP
jgi:hypothetical protein